MSSTSETTCSVVVSDLLSVKTGAGVPAGRSLTAALAAHSRTASAEAVPGRLISFAQVGQSNESTSNKATICRTVAAANLCCAFSSKTYELCILLCASYHFSIL